MAEALRVVIDDDADTVTVDPDTGTITERQPDGGMIVKLDAAKQGAAADDDDDGWFKNLADDMDVGKLSAIASELFEAIEADDLSRQQSLQNAARGLELLGTELKKPSSGVGDDVAGMSTVTNPLLLEAVLKSWANSSAELLPADGPVKIKDDGTETKNEDELAEALERGMNHYLTKVAKEYYPDTSHMLLWGTSFKGAGFKKVYRCPMRRRPVAESVDSKDLIVSDTAKDFASCARITHQIPMRSSVMKRMKLIGAYRDITLTQPTATPNVVDEKIAGIQGTEAKPTRPEDQPYTIWESQCELDIPEFAPDKFKSEGIPLPYIVTMDKETREILSITRDWDEDDEECSRQQMYVRYPYVPGPGFYCTGLLNILGNASAAMTAAWREALDCGMYANFPAGLIAKLGGRQNSATFRLAPGQFDPVETNGLPIGQVVMGLPFKDVTPGLLQLIQLITEQARSLGGAAELPAGEGLANVPVGTMMAQIEQATKIMASAHKGMHQAMTEEIQLIADLFKRHPEDFWRQNKGCAPGFWDQEKLIQALNDCQLVPVSDPNVPSHLHRVAKALGLVQLSQMPVFSARLDPDEVLRRVLAAIRVDPTGLVVQAPPQQTSPEEQAKLQTAAAKTMEANAKIGKLQADQQDQQSKNTLKQVELNTQKEIKTADITKELIIHAADQDKIASAERRDTMQSQMKMHLDQSAGELANQKHGLELVKQGVGAMHEDRTHALDVRKHADEHALETSKHVNENQLAQQEHGLAARSADHDQMMSLREHALDADKAAHEAAVNVNDALNPPKPAAPKGKK